MKKIILSKEIDKLKLPETGKSLCVYHGQYDPPVIAGCRYLPFAEFAKDARRELRAVDTLIVVGLNKAMTPGNRTEMVFEILFNNTPELKKISIDKSLFFAQPWRAWFHFGLVGARYDEYTYSYIAESHYNAFGEGLRDADPFSIEAITRFGRGVVGSTYEAYFKPLQVETIPMSASVKAEYAKEKERCFAEETSIKRIIARLSRFAQTACPQRRIPQVQKFFEGQSPVLKTDLKVDDYLVSQLEETITLTNAIGQAFYNDDNG